ncbi:MAG TPA: DNA-formamidopyrimidine glycosylase family protein, partial [Egibacteraceae bacterium]|nr:DNA-formamidopyrimidine glycosylase family protein [Egibacteraceae bacterium]
MPEGHTIHGLARAHRAVFAGRVVRLQSPQGRFAAGAAELDGRVLKDVQAYGKHLFHRWEGDAVLHIHLGLIGMFRQRDADTPPPPSARLRLAAAGHAADLSGPMVCELIDPMRQDTIVAT